jgi:hypothetical protein
MTKQAYETRTPPFEIELHPNPVIVDSVAIPVALTRDQAKDAFLNSFAPMVLCIDVPRALYVLNMDQANRFFDDTSFAPTG